MTTPIKTLNRGEQFRLYLEKNAAEVTEEEFRFILSCFDWYYDYSDDHRVWSSGNYVYGKIRAILAAHPEYQKVFNEMAPNNKKG